MSDRHPSWDALLEAKPFNYAQQLRAKNPGNPKELEELLTKINQANDKGLLRFVSCIKFSETTATTLMNMGFTVSEGLSYHIVTW